jgi:hypothetical protein
MYDRDFLFHGRRIAEMQGNLFAYFFTVHLPILLQIKTYPECREKAKWLTHRDTKMAKKSIKNSCFYYTFLKDIFHIQYD